MSGKYYVKNWDIFQHYKDRSPPWIKLSTSLFQDYDFGCLQDASKLLAVCIWTIASRSSDGSIPDDFPYIHRQCNLGPTVTIENFNELISKGFITAEVPASKVLASRKQNACLETEAETEGETEGEGEADTPTTFNQHTTSTAHGRVRGGRVSLHGKGGKVVWSAAMVDGKLSTEALNQAKANAPGWDVYNLMAVYAEGINAGKRQAPTNINLAFPAWCGKYTKGKRPGA